LKKLKRSLTWQWGQAREDMFVEANNGGGCGVPRSKSCTNVIEACRGINNNIIIRL
jgi:hypothetical protein